MEHIKLFAIKFIATFALLFGILGMGYDVAFGNVFLITLVVSLISYVIGDMMILPRSRNTTATISDAVLAFIVIYFMTDALTEGGAVFTATLLSTIGLTVFEYFFHKTVANTLEEEENVPGEGTPNVAQLRTEASEELTPYDEDTDK